MKNSSPLSFIISLCLHLALLAFIIFVPTDYTPAPDLDYLGSGLQYRGQISIGPPGERGGGTPRKGDPEGGEPASGKGESIPKPDEGGGQEIKPIQKAGGDDQQQQQVKPIEKQPDPVPDASKPDTAKPIEKQPDDNATPILKDPEKKDDKPKPDDKTKKPADDKTKKPDDKTKKPDDQGKKPADQGKKPTKKDLDSALADLGQKSGRGNGHSVDDALASLGGTRGGSGTPGRGGVRGEADGTGTGGSGPGSGGGYGGGTGSGGGGDGVGIYGAYEDSVVSRIRPNFSGQERADRRNFQAVARLYINPDGSVQNAEIVRPSGNSSFDAAVIRAIMYTKNLERPPSPDYQVMEILFTSESLRN